jgi:Glycosyl transferase family 2
MIIHLYAQCWNDEWMLPFFFRHYDRLVDQYFLYDDGSVDATWSILQAHRKVDARRFVRKVPDSFILSEQAFSNECWKRSRGRADWVIVTDIDEHLFHPAGRDYLSMCSAAGVTLVPALGFQMISEHPPAPHEELARDYRVGAPWRKMMKASIFDPDEILEINFATGRHTANPSGRVQVPETDEMLLLHYKYLDFQQTLQRHRLLHAGLKSVDLQSGWGHKYLWTEEELKADWSAVAENAVDAAAVVRDPHWRYPIRPWWEKYRR